MKPKLESQTNSAGVPNGPGTLVGDTAAASVQVAEVIALLAHKSIEEANALVRAMPPQQVSALHGAWLAQRADECRHILGLPPEEEAPREVRPTPPVASKPKSKPAKEEKAAGADRKARVHAGPCARIPRHMLTRVYRTKGKVRYCVCDDCGHTWKRIGDEAEPVSKVE